MWNSTLELDALEQQVQASSYQRYDDQLDDAFAADPTCDPHDRDQRTYQGWSAPEEGGYQQQDQENRDHGDGVSHHGFQSRSRGRTNHGFDMGQED